jgi:regulator of protease activity HflC (stomatin/prohibitin superfamily)
MVSFSEKKAVSLPGLPLLAAVILVGVVTVTAFVVGIEGDDARLLLPAVGAFIATVLTATGFFVNAPNEAKVLVVFGTYTGTVREAGFWWANPFAQKRKISLKVRNFSGAQIKVNDLHGNPIEIAAVVVWQVTETARASFDVEDFESFVTVQSETAVRALASEYPYDAQDEDRPSLRANPTEVAQLLRTQLQARLELSGVTVLEARLTHLAYAPEIAHAMLRRQQAQAVVAARVKIVEGAVSMVQGALQALAERNIVSLDEERKAAMVNNLLVALVSDKDSQPVINTGSLY